MRLQKYLKEEFYDGIKLHKHVFEIFKNPTRKELDELKSNGDIRFAIDFHKKNVYMWDSNIIHHIAFGESSLMSEFGMKGEYDFYRGNLKDYSRLFTGAIEKGRTRSDSFPGDFTGSFGSSNGWTKGRIEEFRELEKNAKSASWLGKYGIDDSVVQKSIAETIQGIEKL